MLYGPEQDGGIDGVEQRWRGPPFSRPPFATDSLGGYSLLHLRRQLFQALGKSQQQLAAEHERHSIGENCRDGGGLWAVVAVAGSEQPLTVIHKLLALLGVPTRKRLLQRLFVEIGLVWTLGTGDLI